MGSLLDPVNRRMGGINWPLVIHTLVIFSFVTVFTTQSLLLESDSYVDNRDFPGDNLFLPGPFAYQATLYTAAISLIPTVMIYVNTWLADGLLVSSMFNSTPACLISAAPSALSLLRHLCQEPLGHCLTIYDVSRLGWYVFESSASLHQHFRLTSPI